MAVFGFFVLKVYGTKEIYRRPDRPNSVESCLQSDQEVGK
jgi:hypothetical protein